MMITLLAFAAAQLPPMFLRGGDVSEIPEVEANGGQYSYKDVVQDPFAILREAGWNFVRFRIWNHPKLGYCDADHTLAVAKRAQEAGLKISLDFHYSDWWADPGKQSKPAAWKDLPFDKLVQAVYDYTKDLVTRMEQQRTPPYMVQIGNEITSGMLWPDGQVKNNDPASWGRLAKLLDAGIRAVHDAPGGRSILTMIHLDRGGDNKGARWWFDNLARYHVDFDTIGLSYYPFWHGPLSAVQTNVDDLATRYHKDVYIVETGYPWTMNLTGRGSEQVMGDKRLVLPAFPATPDGQALFLTTVEKIILGVPGGRGKGLLYWAPTWISAPRQKNPYDNLALFDFEGHAEPAVDALGHGASDSAGVAAGK
jgi:arabinogalactan endo-1,4-beta-galactosidase